MVGPGGVLESVECAAPLTVRRVQSDDDATCALCLVGTAAGPLAGDDLELSLHLRPGARCTLVAAGASIAQGRQPLSREPAGGEPGQCEPAGRQPAAPGREPAAPGRGPAAPKPAAAARLAMRVRLDAGARLRASPGALIVCEGSRIDVHIDVALATDASLDWRELIVLGRAGDRPGAVTLRWDVTVAGRPLLRQYLELSDPALRGWPGMLGDARVLVSALLAGPDLTARTIVAAPTAVAQRLDDTAVLVTVLGRDAADASAELQRLCAEFG